MGRGIGQQGMLYKLGLNLIMDFNIQYKVWRAIIEKN
jgi:hypothetical protein